METQLGKESLGTRTAALHSTGHSLFHGVIPGCPPPWPLPPPRCLPQVSWPKALHACHSSLAICLQHPTVGASHAALMCADVVQHGWELLWRGEQGLLVCVGECNGHILPHAPTRTTAQTLTGTSFQRPGKLAVGGGDLRPLVFTPRMQAGGSVQLFGSVVPSQLFLYPILMTAVPRPSCTGTC